MAGDKVKLFGMWASPFSLRVEWALKLKGVEYEYIEEDLPYRKSPELLHYNPVTKKVPVLVHGDKAIAESFVIVEYVDEAWSEGYAIMPSDPYERAQARFWAKFAEEKCLPAIFDVFCKAGEEMHKAVEVAKEQFQTLEQALKGKKFFGGETIGYLDIVCGWFCCWLRLTEELAGVSLVNGESLPLMNAWFDNFMDVEVVKGSWPPKEKLYDLNKARREHAISG